MANEVVGVCRCPLCKEPDAEVRRGEKNRLYVVCDGCVSMIRTQSRTGQALIQAMANASLAAGPVENDTSLTAPAREGETDPLPAAEPEKKPAPKAAKKHWFEGVPGL